MNKSSGRIEFKFDGKVVDLVDVSSPSDPMETLEKLEQALRGNENYGKAPLMISGLKTCDHEWIDVGFTHSKMICKKCDKERK